MKREPPPSIVVAILSNICVLLLALVPLCITLANSQELDKSAVTEIANDGNPDFISIDCGSTVDYSENETGFRFQKDEDFVETGENHIIDKTEDLSFASFGRQLNTLRSFPEGNRNCYTLKPKQGKNSRYMIRAFFAYANYDGKNQAPVFDLYLGVNLWDRVNISLEYDYGFKEIIHTPSTDTIHVCLVKIGPTTPYISSLELRLLNNSIYQNQNNQVIVGGDPQPLLTNDVRIDVGSPTPDE